MKMMKSFKVLFSLLIAIIIMPKDANAIASCQMNDGYRTGYFVTCDGRSAKITEHTNGSDACRCDCSVTAASGMSVISETDSTGYRYMVTAPMQDDNYTGTSTYFRCDLIETADASTICRSGTYKTTDTGLCKTCPSNAYCSGGKGINNFICNSGYKKNTAGTGCEAISVCDGTSEIQFAILYADDSVDVAPDAVNAEATSYYRNGTSIEDLECTNFFDENYSDASRTYQKVGSTCIITCPILLDCVGADVEGYQKGSEYVNESDVCATCPANATCNGWAFKCDDGYKENVTGTGCEKENISKVITCPQDTTISDDGCCCYNN